MRAVVDHLAPALLSMLLALAAAASAPANAATFRLDETGTVVSDAVVPMRWRQLAPGRGGDNTVEGRLRVDLRLNLQPWLNQPCRIFMVLAPSAGGERVLARWTTQGRLLPGQIQSGDRVLVYQGPAGPAQLSESLNLSIESDGQRLARPQQLAFHFEIEVSP